MGFGLCLGGIGVGDCGSTSSTQAINITNSAISSAYYRNAFSCTSSVQAGNTVTAAGYCSCGEMGMDTIDCTAYKEQMATLSAQTCDTVAKDRPDMPPELLTCLCHSAGAGCNINVDQKSLITSQQTCTNTQDVQTKLNNNFANDVIASINANMKDIGGLFDSTNQSIVGNFANKIVQNITTDMITNISNSVTAGNRVDAGCGALNFGVTQYSQFTNILNSLNSSSVIQDASNSIANHIQSTLKREDDGFTGWLTSGWHIVIIIFAVGALIVILYLVWRWYSNRQATQAAAAPSAASGSAK
jgi:hypothetical protein